MFSFLQQLTVPSLLAINMFAQSTIDYSQYTLDVLIPFWNHPSAGMYLSKSFLGGLTLIVSSDLCFNLYVEFAAWISTTTF